MTTAAHPSLDSSQPGRRRDPPDISKSFGMIFGTPLAVHLWPGSEAVNRALRDLILAKEAAGEGLARSNVGGWHSRTEFFSWDADCVREIENRVRRLLLSVSQAAMPRGKARGEPQYRIEGWANVNRSYSYNTAHNHSNAVWSGTYYVDSGEPEGENRFNGTLEFLDPRYGFKVTDLDGRSIDEHCLVQPRPGVMVMFPGWLVHQVHPFQGKGTRISIAFNVLRAAGAEAG